MAISLKQQFDKWSHGSDPSSEKSKTPAIPAWRTKADTGKKRLHLTFLDNLLTHVPIKEKLFFVQQLSIMVQTGISLAIAFKTLAEQTRNKQFKKILEDLKSTVERGGLLSDGLERYKKVFGELFINMVRAGEQTGKLEEVLKQLFIQMSKDHAIVSKVKSAMIYPSVVISAMLLVGTLVIVYVIPNLTIVFKDFGADLPLPTKILIAISDFAIQYGLFLAIAFILGVAALIRTIKTKKGKYVFHYIVLKTPILGGIVQKINLARFCRTLSSLLKTDIAIVKSFEITGNVLGNSLYKRAMNNASDKLKKGKTIHDALTEYSNIFPPVVLQMIAVGEETGALDSILEQSASFYEDDVDQIMKNLPSIIEPVLILMLGVAVAGMAVAIIMPIYSLSEQI